MGVRGPGTERKYLAFHRVMADLVSAPEALEVPLNESTNTASCVNALTDSERPTMRRWAKARQVKTVISKIGVKQNLMPKGLPLTKPLVISVHTAKYGCVDSESICLYIYFRAAHISSDICNTARGVVGYLSS